MGLEIVPEHELAARALRRELRLGSCAPAETRFEILRATVWGLAGPSGRAHVNRILAVALAPWRLLAARPGATEEALRERLRDGLSMLEDAGDLVELGGGYWSPAATRRVTLTQDDADLLVGGAPTALLIEDRDAIQFHGPYRHLPRGLIDRAAALPSEPLQAWARLPEAPLDAWAGEVMRSIERVSYSPTSAEAFEFYMPARAPRGEPQYYRWAGDANGATGVLLARRRRAYGAREHQLVEVQGGQISATSELHGIDVVRLMYALDLAAQNPVRARRVGGPEAQWVLRSKLPRAEQRALLAFGTLVVPDEGRFEHRWTFTRNEALALEILRSLGIAMETPSRQESR